jgi:hypothetical protein
MIESKESFDNAPLLSFGVSGMGVGRRSIFHTKELQVYQTLIPLGGDESSDTTVPLGSTSHSSDQRIVNPIVAWSFNRFRVTHPLFRDEEKCSIGNPQYNPSVLSH